MRSPPDARRAVLLVPLLALAGCFERAQPSVASAPTPVQVVRVALAPAAAERAFAGIIRPRREADLAFRAGGRIISREVDVGSVVVAGQVLARLDPTDLALTVRSAEADLASAEAQADQARSDARRGHTLKGQGWTAAATDEVKQAAARAADERVAAARAALSLARNKQEYAALVAPAAGTVTAVMADPGTVMAEGQPAMRLAESGALEAEVALPEGVVAEARTAAATVTVWSRPGTTLRATLRELAPAADAKLRTYTARFTLAEAPAWLAQGMTATVHLGGAPGAAVATLPEAALTDRGAGPIVWVVRPQGDGVDARPVRVLALRQEQVQVDGLRDGELVVGLGVQKLDPAAHVRVADIRPIAE